MHIIDFKFVFIPISVIHYVNIENSLKKTFRALRVFGIRMMYWTTS